MKSMSSSFRNLAALAEGRDDEGNVDLSAGGPLSFSETRSRASRTSVDSIRQPRRVAYIVAYARRYYVALCSCAHTLLAQSKVTGIAGASWSPTTCLSRQPSRRWTGAGSLRRMKTFLWPTSRYYFRIPFISEVPGSSRDGAAGQACIASLVEAVESGKDHFK